MAAVTTEQLSDSNETVGPVILGSKGPKLARMEASDTVHHVYIYIYIHIFINNNTKYIYIYTVTSFKYTGFLNIRTGISYYLRGLAAWPALHIFKCCYRTYRIYIFDYICLNAVHKIMYV